MWKRSPSHQGARVAQDPAGHPRAHPARTGLADRPGPGADGHQGLCGPGSGTAPTPARGSCASRWGRPHSSSRCCWTVGVLYLRAEFQTARELGEQLLSLAQRVTRLRRSSWRPTRRWGIPCSGWASSPLPEPTWSRGLPSTIPQQHRSLAFLYGHRPRGACASPMRPGPCGCWAIRTRPCSEVTQALTLAQELSHPFSLALALVFAACAPSVPPGAARSPRAGRGAHHPRDRAGVSATGWRWELSCGAGRWPSRDRRGGDCADAPGPGRLAGHGGRAGAAVLACPAGRGVWESRAGRGRAARAGRGAGAWTTTGERYYEAELYRLKGELLLQPDGPGCSSAGGSLFSAGPRRARRQQAKSLELRAAMSLSRLWQQQGKRAEAHAAAGRDLRLVHRGL